MVTNKSISLVSIYCFMMHIIMSTAIDNKSSSITVLIASGLLLSSLSSTSAASLSPTSPKHSLLYSTSEDDAAATTILNDLIHYPADANYRRERSLEESEDDLETAAGTNLLRPLFVYRRNKLLQLNKLSDYKQSYKVRKYKRMVRQQPSAIKQFKYVQ